MARSDNLVTCDVTYAAYLFHINGKITIIARKNKILHVFFPVFVFLPWRCMRKTILFAKNDAMTIVFSHFYTTFALL